MTSTKQNVIFSLVTISVPQSCGEQPPAGSPVAIVNAATPDWCQWLCSGWKKATPAGWVWTTALDL